MKMKFMAVGIILTMVVVSGCSQKIISRKDSRQFEFHFAIMDSIAKIVPNDTLVNVLESIAFMEKKTGIEASTDGTFIGRLACTKDDLRRWHEWYIQNLALKVRRKN